MVDPDRSNASSPGDACVRRMVDENEGSVSHRLIVSHVIYNARRKDRGVFRLDRKNAFVTGAGSGSGSRSPGFLRNRARTSFSPTSTQMRLSALPVGSALLKEARVCNSLM